jgi:alpha 1,3-glucosidase
VPVLHQGGSILPIRTRIRRASPLMWQDPYTLVVALSKEGTARGELYSDDGDSFAFQQGEFVWRGFEFSSITAGRAVLRSVDLASHRPKDIEGLISTATAANDAVATYSPANGWAERIAHVRVERVVVLGLKASPRRVTVDGEPVEFDWQKGLEAAGRREGRASELTLKNPPVKIASDWEIRFE